MPSARWVPSPVRPLFVAVCFGLARKAANKGDGARAARLVRQARRFSESRGKSLRLLAKYLTQDSDPNGEEARDHAGIDALLHQVDKADLAELRENYQRIVAFSLVRRGKPVPEPLREAIAVRDDDDTLILMRLMDDPNADILQLLSPLFARYELPEPPLIANGVGIDSAGFHDGTPAHGDKVTVAMTAFNAEETIEHAIRSVIHQTWRNLEFFIINDNSTDGTAAIIEKYTSMDERIIPLHNPANIGTYCSKNRALERATGRWFTCHDSDDWSHTMKIQRQVEVLTHSDAVACTSRWVRSGPVFPVRLRDTGGFAHRNCSSLLFATDAVRDSLGYYDSVKASADVEMLARLQAAFGQDALHDDPAVLSIGRTQAGSLTTSTAFEVKFKRVSENRRIYSANYTRWHRTSKALYIPIKHEPRKFPAPEALIAPAN